MARDKLPYFKWYPKDCDVDENVRAMDDRELGFYMRCLNHAWINGSLPADQNELSRVMKCSKGYVAKVWPRVSRCFESKDTGRLINPRQEKERIKAVEKSGKCTEAVLTRYGRSSPESPRVLAPAGSDDGSGSVRLTGEGAGEPPDDGPLETIQAWLKDYIGHFGLNWGLPDFGICMNVFNALNGASLDDLEALLRDLYKRKQRPTKGYPWFVTVIRGRFEDWNGKTTTASR